MVLEALELELHEAYQVYAYHTAVPLPYPLDPNSLLTVIPKLPYPEVPYLDHRMPAAVSGDQRGLADLEQIVEGHAQPQARHHLTMRGSITESTVVDTVTEAVINTIVSLAPSISHAESLFLARMLV